MTKKLRIEYFIYMLCQLVQIVMCCEVNPEGIANRQVDIKMKQKQPFASQGPLWIISLEGPDKLCGCQSLTFLLGVYGYLDTISRKKLFIFIFFFCNSFSISFSSPSQPEVIEKKYLKYLNEPKLLSHFCEFIEVQNYFP